jgi:N-carbamoylputrescine amidase
MKDIHVAAVVMRSGFGETESNIEKIGRYVKAAAQQGAEVVCFPEMSITGYALKEEIRGLAEPIPGPSTKKIQRIAGDSGSIVVAGLAERKENGGIAVSQVVASPDGALGVYRKTHLSMGERALFEPGDETPVFAAGGTTFGVQLCYDAHFPELSTMLALKGAEILFIAHASPPPESADQKRERWMRYLAARAYDNSVFVVACNQTGDGGAGISFSGVGLILDPRGEAIAETSGDDESMMIVELKAELLSRTRNARMGFFLPHRRPDLYGALTAPTGSGAGGGGAA